MNKKRCLIVGPTVDILDWYHEHETLIIKDHVDDLNNTHVFETKDCIYIACHWLYPDQSTDFDRIIFVGDKAGSNLVKQATLFAGDL